MVKARAAAVAFGLLACAAWGHAASTEPRPGEYEVKAAYLYNFAKFVEWPAAAKRDVFVIGVLGRDPFGPVLDHAVAGKTVGDRKLVVRRFSDPNQVDDVDVLFIASSEAGRMSEVLRQLEGTPTLTVGETDEFVGRGGMVGFRVRDDVVRFDVDLDQSARAGLKVSSQLVRVARRVISGARGQ